MKTGLSKQVELLGIPIERFMLSEAVAACREWAQSKKGGYVCFVNVHSITESQENLELREALNSATFRMPDGMPLVWLSALKHHPVGSRVCGPDFMQLIFQTAPNETYGFIGGAPGQSEAICKRYGLPFENTPTFAPPIRPFSKTNAREDWERFLEICHGSPPKYIWVGLGAPKQELWMKEISPLAKESLFFGVGAAFDFLAGSKERAPQWMRESGLEWVHRLSEEPRRLWKRYLKTNSKFLVYSARDFFFSKQRK